MEGIATLRRSAALMAAGIALVMMTLLLGGCASDECVDNKNALPLAGFYGYQGGVIESIRVDSLEVAGVGAPGDSLLTDGLASEKSLYLPFRIDGDTTKFVFRYLNRELAKLGITDTVTFVYKAQPRFVSAACGVSYVFNISGIHHTGLLVDSVICPGMQITNADRENIRIYFHTDDSDTPPPGE